MFCNKVTLNSGSWRLVLTLPERASVALVALFLFVCQFTQIS
jgi:hypothetical protein